jgi:hypothetical protein
MDYNPKGTLPRATLTPSGTQSPGKTTDAEKAAKLYGRTSPSANSAAAAGLPRFSADVERRARAYGARTVPADSIFPEIRLSNGTLLAEYSRVKLNRDRNRPLEFDGRVLAEVNEASHDGQVMLRAAIYETKGGKFVDELTRFEVEVGVDYGNTKPPYLFSKAEVFDSRDIAAMWFRTKGGRLTQQLMEQLGDVDSEFIE